MTQTTMETGQLGVVRDATAAAALLNPERRRLLDELQERPDSATGLARRLGETRQRLNYHLRALAEAGLVSLASERRRRGFTERVYRVTAKRFLVDPAVFGEAESAPAAAGDRFSATYLLALAARTIREVAGLREKAAREGKRLGTASLDTVVRLGQPSDMEAFTSELAEAVARVVARHQSEEGRPFRVVLGAYPGPAANQSEGGAE